VWGRCGSGISCSERELSLSLDTLLEFLKNRVSTEGENLGVEEVSVLDDHGAVHLIRERIDLKLIEKGSLGGVNLDTFFNDFLGGDNFNLGLDNLGLDLKGLEERGLLWIKTSWSSWDCYIIWGNHTWLGWRWSDLLVEDGLDFGEITVGEDEVSVTFELLEDKWDVLVLNPGVFSCSIVFITLLWSGVGSSEGGLHESVLSHDHDSSDGSEMESDCTDLLGGHVVGVNEHDVLVLGSSNLESGPVCFLLDSLVGFLDWCHFCKNPIFEKL